MPEPLIEEFEDVIVRVCGEEFAIHPEFRRNWLRWLKARQLGPSGKILASRRVSESIAEARLEDCREWGIPAAIAALKSSTGYQGLFLPREWNKQSGRRSDWSEQALGNYS